jgi:hypothetical protein
MADNKIPRTGLEKIKIDGEVDLNDLKSKRKENKKKRGRPKKTEITYADSNVKKRVKDTLLIYSNGLSSLEDALFRTKTTKEEFFDCINSNTLLKREYATATKENKKLSPEHLVKLSMMHLQKTLEEGNKKIERRYLVSEISGQTIKSLIEEKETQSSIDFKAVETILSKFTDQFSDAFTLEKAGRLFYLFNKYLYEKTDLDPDMLKGVLEVEEEFLNQLFLSKK